LVTYGTALADPAIVGHKFARQELLRRQGFPVPEFFCVSPTAFDEAVTALDDLPAGAPPDGADYTELFSWSAAVRSRLVSRGLPGELAQAVLAGFDQLVGADGVAAVRACTVPGKDGAGEDGEHDPFAGLSDSFLYVRRDDALRRVVDCWASAFNPEAIAYRMRRCASAYTVRMAVGVQRMVFGTRSFVVFTANPLDGSEEAVVAAAHGIGEGVVQEKADIDHFFAGPPAAGRPVRAEVTHKERMLGPAPAGSSNGLAPAGNSSGTFTLPVPAELADRPVLTDHEVRQVCDLAARASDVLGGAQDVEGTITDDGTFHLLQARPVVAAGTPAAAPAANIRWSNHNITESFPGVTCALTFSQAQAFYVATFGDFYPRVGVPARRLRHKAHHLRRMIGYLDGRVYYRLDAWYALHGEIPGFGRLRPTWERTMMGLTSEASAPPATVAEPHGGPLRALPLLAVRLICHPVSVRRFLRWWDRARPAADIGSLSADELIARYRALWSQVSRRWGITIVNSYFLLLCLHVVTTLLRRWMPSDTSRTLADLLRGGRENRSMLALHSTIALAELARERPGLREALLRQDPGEAWGALAAGVHGEKARDAALAHLDRYGDRSVHDLKLEAPTPRQEPAKIVLAVRPFIEQGRTVAQSRHDERQGRREARQQLRAACRSPLRRWVLLLVTAALRRLIRAREDTRFCRSELYGFVRQVMGRLGTLLAQAGRLDEPGDVFHLTVDEVTGAFDGTLVDGDLRAAARRRKDELAQSAARPPLPVLLTTDASLPVAGQRLPRAPSVDTQAQHTALASTGLAGTGLAGTGQAGAGQAGAEVLRGLASSSGRVRAPAKLVLDPAIAPETCQGHILVARETDPGWLFLMMAAAGIVVERGTLLSHTAVNGRMLGIPTVVAVAGATARIADGDMLEIDGGAGTVRLLRGRDTAS
jgi:pyruvate,water dikinase